MTIGMFILNLLVISFSIIVSAIGVITTRNNRNEHQEQMNKVKNSHIALNNALLHSEFALKESNHLKKKIKDEISVLKSSNQFVKSAIRDKVKKTKLRPKRRKS